jgi:HAD superfamily 5'-nucleotidase-like hydrolase
MNMDSNAIDPKYRIYCNRSLNMKGIRAIGFDMDYTLAMYKPETFETLAYSETLKKLVALGYPQEVQEWVFDWSYMLRGLAIDKQSGNIIKMDRHRYVKLAYHGFKELSREERLRKYAVNKVLTFEEPNFALVDTLFTLADAYLFSQLVEYNDSNPSILNKSYAEIYKDVRHAIDLCHRDGSIKLRVAESPDLFIERDPFLIDTLERFRKTGRKLFVVTNSLWDYTHVVMNYLFGNDTRTLNESWLEHFDVVVTGSAKPSFFVSTNPLFEVDLKSGLLRNTEGLLGEAKVYQGGNFQQLHKLLGIQSGSEVLYVGDHIYGDILRSKKELGWRTMLVVAELENELDVLQRNKSGLKILEDLYQSKDVIDELLQKQTLALDEKAIERKNGGKTESGEDEKQLQKSIDELTRKRAETRESIRQYMKSYHQEFHRVWGQLMKTGYQNSRFAAQVENYACLYTSRLTNLRHYSPNLSYRSSRDLMPHDFF